MANVHANVITAELGTHLHKHVAACLACWMKELLPFHCPLSKRSNRRMDEVTVHAVSEAPSGTFRNSDKRKEYILDVIRERGALTAELEERIKTRHFDPVALEIYIFRINLNATPAREPPLGLEPLAKIVM